MNGVQLNTDFSSIKPHVPGAGMFPPSDPKLGWLVKIVGSEARENSKKNGMLLVLKFEGIDQPIAGQTAESYYNIANPNQQAVDIAYSELSAIAHVTGKMRVANTAELHGAQLRVIVGPQKDDPNRNEIKGYLDVHGNPPGKAGQGPLAAQPAAFSGGQQPQGGFTPSQPQQSQQPQPAQPPQNGWQTGPTAQQPQQPQGGAPSWAQPPQNGGSNGWHGGGGPQQAPGWAAQGNG